MKNDEKQCPSCGKTIKRQAKKCRFCGKWLEQIIEDYKPTTIPCPYCGEEILPIAKKCKHCKSWLGNNVENVEETLSTNDKPAIKGMEWQPHIDNLSNVLAWLVVIGIFWWIWCAACDELVDFLESLSRFLTFHGY